jgi:predicted molibdopterin-dependent oxidoreductase YjgC
LENKKTGEMMQSVCAYCGVGCEIDAEVENNKITKIKPVRKSVVGLHTLAGRSGLN